ncbi:hypothetical protein ABRU27_001839 [Escherichia coli]
MSKEKKQHFSMRISSELLKQVELLRAEVEKQCGYNPSTTQVVERLISTGLERR